MSMWYDEFERAIKGAMKAIDFTPDYPLDGVEVKWARDGLYRLLKDLDEFEAAHHRAAEKFVARTAVEYALADDDKRFALPDSVGMDGVTAANWVDIYIACRDFDGYCEKGE